MDGRALLETKVFVFFRTFSLCWTLKKLCTAVTALMQVFSRPFMFVCARFSGSFRVCSLLQMMGVYRFPFEVLDTKWEEKKKLLLNWISRDHSRVEIFFLKFIIFLKFNMHDTYVFCGRVELLKPCFLVYSRNLTSITFKRGV